MFSIYLYDKINIGPERELNLFIFHLQHLVLLHLKHIQGIRYFNAVFIKWNDSFKHSFIVVNNFSNYLIKRYLLSNCYISKLYIQLDEILLYLYEWRKKGNCCTCNFHILFYEFKKFSYEYKWKTFFNKFKYI